MYDKTLTYCIYPLEDVFQCRSPCGTGKIRDYIKRIALKLSDHHFFGEDLGKIIDSLTKFVEEANIQEMLETQASFALS